MYLDGKISGIIDSKVRISTQQIFSLSIWLLWLFQSKLNVHQEHEEGKFLEGVMKLRDQSMVAGHSDRYNHFQKTTMPAMDGNLVGFFYWAILEYLEKYKTIVSERSQGMVVAVKSDKQFILNGMWSTFS